MPAPGMIDCVGLMPTMPHSAAGHVIEPSVSVPTAAAAKLAAIAAPEPELEPQAECVSRYGFTVRPPRPLQPLFALNERKFAHSLRFVLPSTIAPARRRFATSAASAGTLAPTRASEPAVVCIASAVAMLSFTTIGMPCSGPRGPRRRRSRSSAAAIFNASGLTSMIELTVGPALSSRAIRST